MQNNLRILKEEIAEAQHWQLDCISVFKKDWVYLGKLSM